MVVKWSMDCFQAGFLLFGLNENRTEGSQRAVSRFSVIIAALPE